MPFFARVVPCFRLNVISRERGTAPRCLLARAPGRVKLIFLVVVSHCSMCVPVAFFRSKMVSNDGPVAVRTVHPLHRCAGLGRQVTRRTKVENSPLAVFVGRVLCSYVFRECPFINCVIFGTRSHDRFSNVLQFVSPRARNCACCFMSLFL